MELAMISSLRRPIVGIRPGEQRAHQVRRVTASKAKVQDVTSWQDWRELLEGSLTQTADKAPDPFPTEPADAATPSGVLDNSSPTMPHLPDSRPENLDMNSPLKDFTAPGGAAIPRASEQAKDAAELAARAGSGSAPGGQGPEGAVEAVQAASGGNGIGVPQPEPQALSQGMDDVRDKLGKQAEQLSSDVADTVSSVGVGVNAALQSANDQIEGVIGDAKGAVAGITGRMAGTLAGARDSFAGTAVSFSSSAQAQLDQALESLPPEVRNAAGAAGHSLTAAKDAFDAAPGLYVTGAALATVAGVYGYNRAVYGGFMGTLTAPELRDALDSEANTVVVDVRSGKLQEDDGVLDLRRAARRKAASVPIQKISKLTERRVRNPEALQRDMTAALICNLDGVNSFTRIVIMDESGQTSKALARAVTAQGCRGFLLAGGFAAWCSEGLPVKKGRYTVTPGDVLADKQAELYETAEATAQQLSQPQNAALISVSSVIAFCAALRPHETFQFLGILGLELSVLAWAVKFESPQEAAAEVERTFSSVIDAVSTGTVRLRRDEETGQETGDGEQGARVQGAPAAATDGSDAELRFLADEEGEGQTLEAGQVAAPAAQVPAVVIDEQGGVPVKANGIRRSNGKDRSDAPATEPAGLTSPGNN